MARKRPSRGDIWKYPIQRYPKDTLKNYFNDSKRYRLIDKDTKVCSMGSCFAIEIGKYLKKMKFKYLVTEKNPLFSANWDKLYNISSLKQVFEYSLDEFNPIVRWWERDGLYQDPLRRAVNYRPELADEKFKKHIIASKEALKNADVITITLGMVELWRDKRDKTTFWRVPPIEHYDLNIHEFHIQDVDEICEEMMKIRNLIPNTKIIWTLSPVALKATFRKDTDCVTANFFSKACLRTAIERFVKNDENSFYFPSYEAITFGYPNRYKQDNRHIKEPIIRNVMKIFQRMYIK